MQREELCQNQPVQQTLWLGLMMAIALLLLTGNVTQLALLTLK